MASVTEFCQSTNDSDADWANVGNIRGTTGYALDSIPASNVGGTIVARNYYWTIPSNAVIDGVKVIIKKESNIDDQIQDNVIRLLVDGSLVGDNKASATLWKNAVDTFEYGGATDMWGLAEITPADANASDFGFHLIAENTGSSTYAAIVWYVTMTIYYHIPIVAPTVTTQAVDDIAKTTATGNGTITVTGGENCTRRGFCYIVGTSGDPDTSDDVEYADGSFGTGAFDDLITGLLANTGYRVRAYAVNTAGTGYGVTVQLTTKADFAARIYWL